LRIRFSKLLAKEEGGGKYQLPTNKQQGNKVVSHEATKPQIGKGGGAKRYFEGGHQGKEATHEAAR
jgi:hypothetical protein